MWDFITQYWWIWITLALLFGTLSIAGWITHYKAKQRMQAQFVLTGSCFMGCIFFIFNVVGIISAILSIISGVIYVFLWWVKR